MALRRRFVIFGVLSSVLTLSFLGFLFLDAELPTELSKFKLATLHRLKSISGSASTGKDDKVHVLPVAGPSTEFDDDIEGEGPGYDGVSPPLSVLPQKADNANPIPQPKPANAVADAIDPMEESDYGSPDFKYPDSTIMSSSMSLTSSLETTVPNGALIHGFFVLDNLVVHNGTFYIVTRNRSAFPEKKEDLVWRPFVSGQVEREPNEEVCFRASSCRFAGKT